MANLAYSPELLPEWHSHTLPDDIFSKFDLEQDRALALSNPTVVSPLTSPAMGIMTVSPCASSPVQVAYGATAPPLTTIPSTAPLQHALHGGLHQSHLLPTPPHSPPTEHDLDDLVASIPEILESQAASPPSDFNDILLDLEGMDVSSPLLDVSCTSTLDQTAAPSWASPLQGASPASSTASWWSPLPSSSAEVLPEDPPVKKDCMWGGLCCPTALEPNHQHGRERTVSECSSTSVVPTTTLPNSMQPGSSSATAEPATNAAATAAEVAAAAAAAAAAVSSCDEEEEDMSEDEESTASETHHLPDTPSGTDSDCDSEDAKGAQSHHHASNSSSSGPRRTSCSASVNSFYSDHNYSERVPVNGTSPVTGIMTPSDTEDEVDVVSFNDSADIPNSTTTTDTTPTTETSTKRSADVKRQLQLAIQESMRNRQNRTSGAAPPNADENGVAPVSSSTNASKLVSVKIRTQGKPAAYTKRMRDCHLENMKSTKHRRRNRAESDDCRRNTHNSLERQRRVELRNAFEHLRQLVPETKVLGKAPKVQILKKAALCCMQMQQAEERLLKETDKLKKYQELLKQKIRMLTS
ncbi:uncharacterized protein LOC143032336 [Oratosquilla oratoria]|uniref:uncharacterized protein LOC143032336 n=1 Tax=Oratosquilla oratoria TaxID=337810 RepID=UPI003F7625A1